MHDNQRVKQGDLLIQIDPVDYRVRLEQARGQLALAAAQIDQTRAAIEQARAAVEENDQRVRQADAQAVRARRDFDRAFALMNTAAKAISQQDLDAARAGQDAANANLDAAKAMAHAARAQEQVAEANHKAAFAQRDQAAAAVHTAELELSYTRVLAPVDGWVTNLNLPPGNYLAAGQSPLAMVADHTWRVVAYYKETFAERMRPGQQVSVRLFPYPDRVFKGVVEGIGWGIYQPDGQANAGTLQLPEVAPTINWVRLPQRFPVRIDLPQEDAQRPFRIGQTAVVGNQHRGRDGPRAVAGATPDSGGKMIAVPCQRVVRVLAFGVCLVGWMAAGVSTVLTAEPTPRPGDLCSAAAARHRSRGGAARRVAIHALAGSSGGKPGSDEADARSQRGSCRRQTLSFAGVV